MLYTFSVLNPSKRKSSFINALYGVYVGRIIMNPENHDFHSLPLPLLFRRLLSICICAPSSVASPRRRSNFFSMYPSMYSVAYGKSELFSGARASLPLLPIDAPLTVVQFIILSLNSPLLSWNGNKEKNISPVNGHVRKCN